MVDLITSESADATRWTARFRRGRMGVASRARAEPEEAAAAIGTQSVLAFVGLLFEARIAAGPGVVVFCRQTGRGIAESLERAINGGCRSIISFGVAGGLSPDLRPGDWVIASRVESVRGTYATSFLLSRKLLECVPGAEYSPIAGVDVPILSAAAKRQLHEMSGVSAVDMESHMVAEFATARGLDFGAIRVVIDPAERSVPMAALMGLRPDGSTDVKAVLRGLIRSPQELPLLARVVGDAFAARNALIKIRRMLGPGLGLLDHGGDRPLASLALAGADRKRITAHAHTPDRSGARPARSRAR
jgi:adenosylhomocysteine nucleosidase